MVPVLLALFVMIWTQLPGFAQSGVSGYYRRMYTRRQIPQPSQDSSLSDSSNNEVPSSTEPDIAPNRSAPSRMFSGEVSPTNMPNASMKGFGAQSHWLDRPGATRETSQLSAQADSLMAKHLQAKSKGDLPGAAQSNASIQNLARQLTSMEPQEAKWRLLLAKTYIYQAGGPSRSGTAGDRFSLTQAIRELDLASACPNSAQYSSQIKTIRATTDAELQRRVSKGIEIRRRGARQFAEIYGRPGGDSSSGSGPSWCTVCGKCHSSGGCTYRRD